MKDVNYGHEINENEKLTEPEISLAKKTIASGAVLIKNLIRAGTYAGNPGRIFKIACD